MGIDPGRSRSSVVAWMVALCLVLSPTGAHALPAGFQEQEIPGPWNGAAGLAWGADGLMYVVERGGKVWVVEDGVRQAVPFLDISSEVGGWRDYGLLGFVLHPNFARNRYVYAYYVVDHYDLMRCNAARDNPECRPPAYDVNANQYFQPTIGRITRYTADPATNFRTVIPGSRKVLLGETVSTGFPILHQSHGTGQLVFGEDGTLLATCGDAASYNVVDLGSHADTYFRQALDEGILRPDENIGALRSQYLGSLDGKMIRIDPETGDGIASNPFYDAAAPRSAQSRTWALGLRNPYRFVRKPGTGDHDPAVANPGVFFLGDVGWNAAEDLHVVDRPGLNLGWPHFEGMTAHGSYSTANVANLLAPNPLFGVDGCNQQYFYFKNLIVQERGNGQGAWPNPCNPNVPIPDAWTDPQGRTWRYFKFMHRRPPVDWRGQARVATFDANGAATTTPVGAAGSPVAGSQFSGNSSTGGTWYTRDDFPPAFRNTYFHGDYGGGWVKSFVFDANHRPSLVQNFVDPGNAVVFIGTSPTVDGLYYVKWGDRVRRIVYNPGNRPPLARATPLVHFGASPLSVSFTNTSVDPEGQALTHQWDFGDGTGSVEAAPTHVFTADGPTTFSVRLTVTDPAGAAADTVLTISVNNTPPEVEITSPRAGQEYSMAGQTSVAARARIADAEHARDTLTCVWQVSLHHDSHVHDEPPVEACETDFVVSPAGCEDHTFFYRAALTVTDPAGLSTRRSVDLHPDCANDPPRTFPDRVPVARGELAEIDVLDNDWDIDGFVDPATVAIVAPPAHGLVDVDDVNGLVRYRHDGGRDAADQFSYVVADDRGLVSADTTVDVAAFIFPFIRVEQPAEGGILTAQRFTLTFTQDYLDERPAVAVFVDGVRVHSQAAQAGRVDIELDTPPRGPHRLMVALVDAAGQGDGTSVGEVRFEVVPGPDWDEDFDGVPDLQDDAPLDPFACGDADADTCDDCIGGRVDPWEDGPDGDLDGLCDDGDFNGCDVDNGSCDALTRCTASAGGRLCSLCPPGYTGDGVSGCVDVDECVVGNGGCDAAAVCVNTPGTRTCTCPVGFVGDGLVCRSLDVAAAVGPGARLQVRDAAYAGGLAGMTCAALAVDPVRWNATEYGRVASAPEVDLGVGHPRLGDLVVKLVAPDGAVVPLLSRPGVREPRDKGNDGLFGDTSDLVAKAPITLADGAPTGAETLGAQLGPAGAVCRDDARCRFYPDGGAATGLSKLGALVGRPAVGRWRVCVGDATPGSAGTLDRAALRFRLGR
jgi:glucose/arabinose dehydrogenase/PKD repeat protein